MKKRRKLNRKDHYDYAQEGLYFITICVENRQCLLGDVYNDQIKLSNAGEAANNCWHKIPEHFPNVVLDQFAIMPNHIHGIIVINGLVGNNNYCSMKPQIPWQTQWAKSLSLVVRGFKIGVVKFCKENRIDFSWQKSFYDHIVRDDAAYARIVRYIIDNPKNWRKDRNNLENLFM